MRNIAFTLLVLVLAAPAVWADELPAKASVGQILDALDARGHDLRGFVAHLSDSTDTAGLGNDKIRTGMLWFQKQDGDRQRVHVLFDRVQTGRLVEQHKNEYLLDAGWLWDRNYDQKSETKRQVLKPGQKQNLLKLGEGPFPLPVGQKKEEVLKLFDVVLTPADPKGDVPNTLHLTLTPKPDTEFARKFSTLDIWVDRATSMPVVIETANGDDVHRIELKDLQLNPANLGDEQFSLPPIDSSWNQKTEELER